MIGWVTKNTIAKMRAMLRKPRSCDWLSVEAGSSLSRWEGVRLNSNYLGGKLGYFHYSVIFPFDMIYMILVLSC
jgi:hypothetical protein